MNYDDILILAEKFADHIRIRPNVMFKNYDYGTQTKSEKENTKLGPGSGFYSNMDKYKSVKDFVDSDRKMKRKQRKKKLAFLCLAENKKDKEEIDLEDIPEDVLHDGEKNSKEVDEISEDKSIAGIPFINRIDPYPSDDSSLAAPVGYLFDNDVMRNSYEGIFSNQGSEIDKSFKLAELFYDLVQKR
jgi:hypothetical protein